MAVDHWAAAEREAAAECGEAAGGGVADNIRVFDGPVGSSISSKTAAVYRFLQTPNGPKENSNGNCD